MDSFIEFFKELRCSTINAISEGNEKLENMNMPTIALTEDQLACGDSAATVAIVTMCILVVVLFVVAACFCYCCFGWCIQCCCCLSKSASCLFSCRCLRACGDSRGKYSSVIV